VKYFLVVYDQSKGRVDSLRAYPEQERLDALHARFTLERQYLARPQMEVVVLGAPSKAALLKTHGRYFETAGSLLRSARPAGLKHADRLHKVRAVAPLGMTKRMTGGWSRERTTNAAVKRKSDGR
jgi:hypothetical protein